MFEGDSADTCALKFPPMSMGGRAEGLESAYPGVLGLAISEKFYLKLFLVISVKNILTQNSQRQKKLENWNKNRVKY